MNPIKKNKLCAMTLLLVFFLTLLTLPNTALAAGAVVSGKVQYAGTAPVIKEISFGAEKQCELMHGGKKPTEEILVVNPDNTLKNALVYIKEGVSGEFPVPDTPVEIDQNGCLFSPHVSVARAGQKVIFKNNDSLLHNVRTVSTQGQVFNIAQPLKDMKTQKVFQKSEIGIQLKCDVHFWMLAYLHVLSHPFYAVTGDDGSFKIADLPAGTYTVEVWHEKLGTQTQQITVADGEEKALDFSLGAA